MHKHVIIIGGGPAGYHSALSCRSAGMEVTLIEQNQVGGTCTHSGCIPTRAYLSAIKAYSQLTAANPSLASSAKLNPAELAQSTAQKISQLTFGMQYMLQRKKIHFISETASITGPGEVTLASGQQIHGDHIIVATGSTTKQPENHTFTHLYTVSDLLSLKNLPEAITVVGGGVLGIELSVILQSLGCHVTLTEQMAQLLPSWDTDVAKHIQTYLERMGVHVLLQCDTPPGEQGVFCIGRTPRLPHMADGLSLDAPWLHLLGDAAGEAMTADFAITQGQQAAALLQGKAPAKENTSPRCLFTPLEAAFVGAQASPKDRIAYQDLGYSPAGVLFDGDLSMIKVVIDGETAVIKGVHVVSSMASEVIQLAQMAVSQKLTVEEFCAMTFPHPTEGELLKEVMRSAR